MKQHLTLSLLTTALLTACGGVYNEHPAVDPPGPKADNPAPPPDMPSSDFQIDRHIALTTGVHHRHYDDGLHKTLETDITKTSDYSNTAITPKDSKMPRLRLPTYYSSTKEGNILIYGSLDGKGTINKRDNLAYKSFQMSAPSYRFSQFGMFNVDNGYTSFWRGQQVTKMPQEGLFYYQGDSIVGFLNDKGIVEHIERGTANAAVDFGLKRLNFTLNSPGYQGKSSGIISYNGQEKEANFYSSRNSQEGIKGKFAGENAEEMVGRYVDSAKKIDAVFGAKRQ